MTFEEYKAAMAKTPLSEEERQKVQDFQDAMRGVKVMLIRARQDEVGNALEQYASSAVFLTTDPERMSSEESRKAWAKDAEKLDGLHDFLLQGDNFKNIMQVGVNGEKPAFGADGKLFFDLLGILQKVGIQIDANEWKKHYDDMKKGLDWKKDAKLHKVEEPVEQLQNEEQPKEEAEPEKKEEAEPEKNGEQPKEGAEPENEEQAKEENVEIEAEAEKQPDRLEEITNTLEDQSVYAKLNEAQKLSLLKEYLLLQAKQQDDYEEKRKADPQLEEQMSQELTENAESVDAALRYLIQNVKDGTHVREELDSAPMQIMAFAGSLYAHKGEVDRDALMADIKNHSRHWSIEENLDQVNLETQPAEPENLREKFAINDLVQGQSIAGTVLFGMLNDVLSPEKQDQIFKKLSVYSVTEGDAEKASDLYGKKIDAYAELKQNGDEELTRTSGEAQLPSWSSGHYEYFAVEEAEQLLKIFREGLKEVLEAMDQKAEQLSAMTPAQQNYFLMMRQFIQDAYTGDFTRKVKEDSNYLYASNMLIKISKTSPSYEITGEEDEGYEFHHVTERQVDDMQIANDLHEAGIMSAMAGGVKTARMVEEHLTNGDVSRDDLIAEYGNQVKRLDKALNLSEAAYEKLRAAGAVQNERKDFLANTARGFGYAAADAKARKEMLEAGYPVSDLALASAYTYMLFPIENDRRRDQQRLKELNGQENLTEEQKQEKAKLEESLKKEEKAITRLKGEWQNIVGVQGVSAQDRQEKFADLRACAKEIGKVLTAKRPYAQRVADTADRRMEAELDGYDMASMTQDVSVMVKLLKKVDPKLVSSSKQFAKMKDALERLAQKRENLDLEDEDDRAEYKDELRSAMSAVRSYLRYKTVQMHDPKSSHSRSKLEARRVRMADAIFNGLKMQRFPGEEEPVLDFKDVAKAVVPDPDQALVLGLNDKKNLPVGYDSYIKLHTGRACVNAPEEERINHIAKIIAAYMLKNEKKPFAVSKIHKRAEQLKDRLLLKEENTVGQRRFLQEPDKLAQHVKELLNDRYGIGNLQDKYNAYVERMRELYKNLPEPYNHEDPNYTKLFETVKQMAHMPDSLEGLDEKKVQEAVIQANYEMIRACKDYIKAREKNLEDHAQEVLDIMVVVDARIAKNYGYTQDTIDQINKTRGFTYIDQRDWRGREFVEKSKHGMGKLKKNNDLDEPRKLDEALITQSKEKYTGTMERVKNAFAQKEAGKEILKDAPAGVKRPQLDPEVRPAEKKAEEKKPEEKKPEEKKKAEDKKADKPVRRNSVL